MEATGEGKHAPNSDGEDALNVVAPEYVIFGPDRVRMIPNAGFWSPAVVRCRDPGIDRTMVDGRNSTGNDDSCDRSSSPCRIKGEHSCLGSLRHPVVVDSGTCTVDRE